MYVWIWRRLPGPLVLRMLQALVLLGIAVAVLFVWVFPRVEAAMPYSDVTVPEPTASPHVPAASTATPPPAPAPAPTHAATLPAG